MTATLLNGEPRGGQWVRRRDADADDETGLGAYVWSEDSAAAYGWSTETEDGRCVEFDGADEALAAIYAEVTP